MIEACRQPRLTSEAFPEGLVLAELWGKQLEGDLPLEHDVLCSVDDAHATMPEQCFEPIAGEVGTDARDPAHAYFYHCLAE